MNDKLKILQITNRLPWPLNDGGNIATYYVAHHLLARGHQLVLASLNTSKHRVDPASIKGLDSIYTVDLYNEITLIGLAKGLFCRAPYNIQRFYAADFESLLIDLLRKEAFDIVQLEGSYLSIYIPVIRKYSQSKIVLRSHNVEGQIWERVALNEKNIFKKIYLKNLVRKIKRFECINLHAVDGIIAITDKDRFFYETQGYKGKLATINAGVDFSKFMIQSVAKEDHSICFLGSLEWLPNVQGLTWFVEEVWPLVLMKYPNATFYIAGKNTPSHVLKWQIKGVKVEGMVADAVAFLNQHAIMVVPLLSGGGMRLKIVEGMALGKAIVSTTIGAEGIAVETGKHILLADTAQEFAQSVIKLLSDRQLVRMIGENALHLANDQYNWLNLVNAFEQFYQELINESSTSK